jgi:hypothetical protein
MDMTISFDTLKWLVGGVAVVFMSIAAAYLSNVHKQIAHLKDKERKSEIKLIEIDGKLELIKQNQNLASANHKEIKDLMTEIKDALLRKQIL